MEGHDVSASTPPRKNASPVNEKAMTPSSTRNPPHRDLLQEKRNSLRKGTWALDEALFRQHFGEAAYESRWFLEGLVCLSKVQPDFNAAWQLLEKTYKGERTAETLLAGDPSHWVWTRLDIKHAMEAIAPQTATPERVSAERSRRRTRNAYYGGGVENSNDQLDSRTGDVSGLLRPLTPSQVLSPNVHEKTEWGSLRPLASTASINAAPEPESVPAEAKRPSSGFILQKTLTDKVFDIKDKNRQEFASDLIKMITDQTREDIRSKNFSLPAGKSADGLGLKLGLALEFEIYLKFWGSEAGASAQYEAKIQMVTEKISTNPLLRRQALIGAISPKQLCGLSHKDIANSFLKKGDNQGQADEDQTGRNNDQFSQNSQKRSRRSAVDQSKQKGRKSEREDVAAKSRQNNNERVASRGRKRDRSEDSADAQDKDTSDERVITNKAKDDSKRIQGLNKITKEYIQPDQEDVAVSYLDTCLVLPPDAPLGWPHLIDLSTLSKVDTTGLHVADMVVTVLYNHNPETLSRFMDMSHGFTFHVKELLIGDDQDFLIVRTATTVTCGFVDQGRRWSVKHRYGLRATPMARWTPLCLEEYEGEELEDCVIVDDVVMVMVAGEALAYEMLEEKVWLPTEGARIHVRNSAAWRS